MLQEAADRGIALETDCDFVGVAGSAPQTDKATSQEVKPETLTDRS